MRFRWTLLLMVGFALLLVCYQWNVHQSAAGHTRVRTKMDLAIISQAIKTLSTARPAVISEGSFSNLNACVLYELLSATNAGPRFLEPRQDWDSTRELLDRWGRPFRMEVIVAGENANAPQAVSIRLWSVGPNGKDENGAGDDVTCPEVDMSPQK